MRLLSSAFTLIGFCVSVMWAAGALGVGDFRLYYGPHVILRDHTHVEIKPMALEPAIQTVKEKVRKLSS